MLANIVQREYQSCAHIYNYYTYMPLDKELEELQGLFTEDPEIASKRKEVLLTIKENDLSSFPADISILSAFDDVLSCFALGGQIRNYYRYGSYDACAAQREKFWFALWNGSLTEKKMDVETLAQNPRELERRRKVQEFYKKRLMENMATGSSEDVWSTRTTPVTKPFRE